MERARDRAQSVYGKRVVRVRITDVSPPLGHTASRPCSVAAIAG
jgi:hypothetical protein